MTPGDVEELAKMLRLAEEERSPIAAPSSRLDGFDVIDAYRVQLHNIAERIAQGRAVRGHKVGLSSKAMQDMMGVDEPDYGHLLDDMFVFEDDVIDSAHLCQPRVEVEIAFVLGSPLPSPGCNVADVLRATAHVLPALEIIDSRIEGWNIGLPDTIADNASSARVVLGGRATAIDAVDLRRVGATLRRNGEIVATGTGGAVLGNPATAVAWLANKVHSFGVTLEAGHVILPGSCTRAFDVGPGDHVGADFDTLGSVAVRFS
jgi:2-keto-4-pentenoate hydratase